VTVLRRKKSRTFTTPRVTLVNVPLHWLVTPQIVPRTVAALYLPLVVNFPCALPVRRPSTLLLSFAALAFLPTVAHTVLELLLSITSSSVKPFWRRCCSSLKIPALKSPSWNFPFLEVAVVMCATPEVVSSTEPTGIWRACESGMK